jgi:uncharacterized membrane protein
MQINDPFRINDWNIKHFLAVILAVQAAVLLVVGLSINGTDLPIIRQIVLFVYLIFIPGILILRALNLHDLGSVNTTLYSIGLSLVTTMLIGLSLNVLLPLAGYTSPITLSPLTAALTAFVLVMCVLCYVRDRHYEGDAVVELEVSMVPWSLLLMLVPFTAVFGTYLVNNYSDNILLLLMIAIIGVIVLLVGFTRLVPKKLFPLVIFVIALSLLFHNSLISDNLVGWDIHQEKYLADSTIIDGHWDVSVNHVINSMLSIMLLAPIISILTNIDIIWVYKIIFPLFFALVPVVLYQVYRKQSDEKLAFMAAFFFVSLVVFFSEMLSLARQELAELFLSLILLLIVDRSMNKSRWSLLFLAFAIALVLSHYGLTYIFIGTIIVGWALIYVVSKLRKSSLQDVNRRLGPMVIVALLAFCAIWYIYTSTSNPLTTMLYFSNRIEKPIEAAVTDFMTPETAAPTLTPGATPVITPIPGGTPVPTAKPISGTPTPPPATTQPIQLISSSGQASFLHRMFLYLLLSTQGLIVVGLLTALFAGWPMQIRREFFALALINLMMLGAALVVPYFASSLNTTRTYQIALIFLAPFFVLGWVNVFKAAGKITKRSMPGTVSVAIAALSVFMVLYLIFNTGMVFEIARDVPMSYSLDKQGANVSYTIYNSMEKAGAEWSISVQQAIERSNNMTYTPPIFSDIYRWLFLQDWNASRSYLIPFVVNNTPPGSYVYLGTYNVLDDKAIQIMTAGQVQMTVQLDLKGFKDTRNKIYANGGSEVYN